MRSWQLRAAGDSARFELQDAPVPEPGPRQLLVRVRAAGLNRGELIVGHGLTKAGTAKPAGMEAAGEVVKAGAEARSFQPGDRVMGRCPGAFSEFALMDEREAIAMPPALDFVHAAAIPLVFLVVHDMLVAQGRLRKDEWLLVAGVSSGVGVA